MFLSGQKRKALRFSMFDHKKADRLVNSLQVPAAMRAIIVLSFLQAPWLFSGEAGWPISEAGGGQMS